uniref:ATP synthase F0 subunit 8 n=1 Tax=Stygobromus foliatus TaxID=1678291 RepID=A0A172QHE3_9CRUS|nr:ATP synthase F0 subunit 8 [Stygobromus foliatus]
MHQMAPALWLPISMVIFMVLLMVLVMCFFSRLLR